MKELPNLDFMRSIAVLLVVFTHVRTYMHRQIFPSQWIWFLGLIGVFIFFTHTTLVLMWSLERDPHTLRFYLRRIFRLYPLWLVVLALSVAVHLPTSPAYAPQFRYYHANLKELVENALLVFNLGRMGDSLIGASWSLPVEAQMYIVLPFLFFFIRNNRQLLPLLILDVLAMATAHRQSPAITHDLLFCTPLFLPGAMAYLGFKKRKATLPAWTFVLWLVLLISSDNAFGSHFQQSFRSGWIFTLLLGLSLPFFRQLSWRPLLRVSHYIARYSYGLYLCHFAAIAVALHWMAGQNAVMRVLAFFTVLIGLSVLFYHTVEEPMIRVGSRLAKRIEPGPEPRIDQRELSLETVP